LSVCPPSTFSFGIPRSIKRSAISTPLSRGKISVPFSADHWAAGAISASE
jgi:hypothetical protein